MNKAILKNCLIHLLLSMADISFTKLLKLESFLSLKQIHRNGFISQCKLLKSKLQSEAATGTVY